MEPTLDFGIAVLNITLAVTLAGVSGIWIYFLVYMIRSFRLAPSLESFDSKSASALPLVTVILPARNEEKYLARCLDTLLAQDYPNFEIIAVNDNSTDRTAEIIESYARRYVRVVTIDAPPTPEGWVGKNWACIQGYNQATGDYIFFTDADTEHAPNALSLAVGHMVAEGLDALTAIPKLVCKDFWTRITLPGLSTFLHTRFSPLRVNDPRQKTGYFFGSFFIITRRTYEAVGTHFAVREELAEDGALGARVKADGHHMKMVRGEKYVDAIWARDLSTLWHGLRRLVIPLYHQNKRGAHLMAAAVFFIMFAPFLFLSYSLPVLALAAGILAEPTAKVLIVVQAFTIVVVVAATSVQSRFGVFQNTLYGLAAPVGGAIIWLGFASAIVDATKKDAVRWRDRQYTVSEKQSFLR